MNSPKTEDASVSSSSDVGPMMRWFWADGRPLRRAWRLGLFLSVFGPFPGMLALNGSFFRHNWEGPLFLLIYIPYFFVSYLGFIFPTFMILSFVAGFGGSLLVARVADRNKLPAAALISVAATAVVAVLETAGSDDATIAAISALFWFAAAAFIMTRCRSLGGR